MLPRLLLSPLFSSAGVPLHVVSAPHLTLRKDFPLSAMSRTNFPHINPRVGTDIPPLPAHMEVRVDE